MSDQDPEAPAPALLVRVCVLAVLVLAVGGWLWWSIDWSFFTNVITRKSELAGREELSRVYISRKQTIEARRTELARTIRAEVNYHVSPINGLLSWASPLLTRHAEAAGVTISAMLPLAGRPAPWTEDPTTPRVLVSASIRLDLVATEQQFARFLSRLEASNPYLCVTSVTMLDGRGEPARRITTVIEWPMWGGGTRAAYAQKLLEAIP